MAFAQPLAPLAGEAAATRLLLIERDPLVARSLELILASSGFEVEVAHRADQGVALAAASDYHLVLLGPNPPEVANESLANRLRLVRIDRPTRFLCVSLAPDGGPDTMRITPFP